MLVGIGAPMVKIPLVDALTREIEIRSVFHFANVYPKSIALIASKKLDPMKLVSHIVPIEQGVDAYEMATNPAKSGAVKVIVDCEENSKFQHLH